MTMRHITTILLLFGLFACNSSQDKKQSDPKAITIEDKVLPKTRLYPLFDSLRPPTQTFTIRGDRDTLLVGWLGTTFTILKNTFVNSQGEAARIVSIDLVEAFSIDDIINLNLQTTSGDKILQTGGMFFIDAKENNHSLTITEDKSIYVEIQTNSKDPEMEIFEGKYDATGKMDWTATGKLEKNLVPFPLKEVNFRTGALVGVLSEKQIQDLSKPKFENTYIATREFEDRIYELNTSPYDCSRGISQKFVDIYTSHIHKPLYYADSLMAAYLATNYKDKIDTSKSNDWSETGCITYMFQVFTEQKKQLLSTAINLDKPEITESTTIEELIEKGYSEQDAAKFITFFKARQQYIKSGEEQKRPWSLQSPYSFSLNKTGWINVGRFIDDKNTEPSTFLVQVKSNDPLDFISVSLVIPGYSAAVFSIHNDGNLYSFTKKNDGYRKLPVGQDAIIVAFSYKDNKPYFGQQKIKITKDGQIDLALTASNALTIKQDINKLTE